MPSQPVYSTLVELLHDRAQHQPHQTAYIFLKDGETKSVSITYQELDRQARAIATQLHSLGLSGSRALVVYSYSAGLEFITAFFGCLYAGVVAVSSHPPQTRPAINDLQTRLASSQAKVVLTQKNLLATLKKQLAPQANQLCWLVTDTITFVSDWIAPALNGDTLAFLQYTSGSTGVPKGVMITHQCLLHNEQLLKLAFGHTEKSIGVGWLPLFHDMGLIGNVLQGLYVGAPCILMSPLAFVQKPIRWLQAISRYRATTSGGPNFAYDLLCRQVTDEQKQGLDLSCWEVAFSGAESVRAQTIERFVETFEPYGFRREAFYPCYGMAESTLFISGGVKTNPPAVVCVEVAALQENRIIYQQAGIRLVSCGQAWLDEKIIIVNPQSLAQCADNQVGEIWVSSPSVGKGYWNLPEETDHTFQAYLKSGEGPFLRTGDLGFLGNGELFITGRLKEVMNFWGFSYYPQQIEQTVETSHPALRSNCGAAFSDTVGGEERLVVVQEVERRYQQGLMVDEIVEAIRWAIFREHFIDVSVIALLKSGSLPKTASGKIQRRSCKDQFLNGSFETIGNWQGEPSDITSLIQKYFNPSTHLKRYLMVFQGRLRRFLYLWLK